MLFQLFKISSLNHLSKGILKRQPWWFNVLIILQVVIEVHNEQDPVARPSSLQQLQEMLDIPKNLENINQNTMDAEDIPQEKDGFLSRKVGYEIGKCSVE